MEYRGRIACRGIYLEEWKVQRDGPGRARILLSCLGVFGISTDGIIVGSAWRTMGIPMWPGYLEGITDDSS